MSHRILGIRTVWPVPLRVLTRVAPPSTSASPSCIIPCGPRRICTNPERGLRATAEAGAGLRPLRSTALPELGSRLRRCLEPRRPPARSRARVDRCPAGNRGGGRPPGAHSAVSPVLSRPAFPWYVSRMTTISTFRMVSICLSLLSIPLTVKAQTACMNCSKAFPCNQKYKECTESCKVYPFGDDSRVACGKSCQPTLTECMTAARNRCGYWCTP